MYGGAADGDEGANGSAVRAEMDIEAAIQQELEGMKRAQHDGLFQPVRIDVACGKLTALWRGLHPDAASMSSLVLQKPTTHRTRRHGAAHLLGCTRILSHQTPSLDQETDAHDEDGESDGKRSG